MQRDEAVKVFEHFVGLGMEPNMMTYTLLIDAHLIMRDPKAALTVIDDMVILASNCTPHLAFIGFLLNLALNYNLTPQAGTSRI